MCGRFTLTADPADLKEAFDWINFGNIEFSPRYNIAPTQPTCCCGQYGRK